MADYHIIASGLRFPEAPVCLPDGSVIVTEIAAGRITRIAPDGAISAVAEPGGGPNGLAIGPDGLLYCCNNGGFEYIDTGGLLIPHGIAQDYSGGRIERINIASGAIEMLYKSGDHGPVLRGPNDIVFDDAGDFWFTDHGKNDLAARTRDITGIYYAKADGSLLNEAIFPSENPNGIGLSPDGKTLYAAETYTCRLMAFAVQGPGQVDATAGLGGPGIPLYRPSGYKFFDSLALEECGNICVATIGECGIHIISPAGAFVEFVPTDDPFTTNIAFGGPDMRDAYITLSGTGRVIKMRWPRPGLKLHYS
jgi:gluconolactonase